MPPQPDPRVLITGGRVGVDDRIASKAFTVVVAELGGRVVFGDGKAPGYDTVLNALAKQNDHPTERYPVDKALDGDGDDAPKRRNLRMFDQFKPTHCLSMPGGPGTRHMWMHCFNAGIPVFSVEFDNGHLHICLMRKNCRAKTLFDGPLA